MICLMISMPPLKRIVSFDIILRNLPVVFHLLLARKSAVYFFWSGASPRYSSFIGL